MLDGQQAITMGIVAVASVYLGRLGWKSWKATWASRSGGAGCGGGCARCGTANLADRLHADDNKPQAIIPLASIGGLSTTGTKPRTRRPNSPV